jgi:flagellar biosynthesis/type III secretory pathway chaperone
MPTTAAEQLTNIVEYKSWVAAKLHRSDQKQFARRVAEAVADRFNKLELGDRIDGILVYFNDVGSLLAGSVGETTCRFCDKFFRA